MLLRSVLEVEDLEGVDRCDMPDTWMGPDRGLGQGAVVERKACARSNQNVSAAILELYLSNLTWNIAGWGMESVKCETFSLVENDERIALLSVSPGASFGADRKATTVAHGRPGIASNVEALC